MKKQKYFIVYEVVKNEKGEIIDLLNRYDNNSLKEVAKWCNIDYTNISKYVIDNIDNINCYIKEETQKDIKKANYFIFKDYE